jgi:hypothetical protein
MQSSSAKNGVAKQITATPEVKKIMKDSQRMGHGQGAI